MSRRHSAEKREINPDPKFGDLVITKFMECRHVWTARSRPPKASSMAPSTRSSDKTRQEPVGIFHQALENVAPHVEVRSRRVGGADLPGSGRCSSGAPPGTGHPLADHCCAQNATRRP